MFVTGLHPWTGYAQVARDSATATCEQSARRRVVPLDVTPAHAQRGAKRLSRESARLATAHEALVHSPEEGVARRGKQLGAHL